MGSIHKESIGELVSTLMRDVPSGAAPAAVTGVACVVRRALVDDLLAAHTDLPAAWRRSTRQALPPLAVPLDGLLGWHLPWLRHAAALLLALAASGALWQGLHLPLGGLAALVFTALCSAALLKAGQACLLWELSAPRPAAKADGAEPPAREHPHGSLFRWLENKVRGSWKAKGVLAWLVWKNVRRLLLFWVVMRGNMRLALVCLWGMLLGMALLRDFILGRAVLEHFLDGTRVLLEQGNFWPLFSSFYGFWGWLACVLLVLAWPQALNRRLAAARLCDAACCWRENAEQLVEALAANVSAADAPAHKRMAAVGQELYSFAQELDETRRGWLLERLRDLDLEFPQEDGDLRWHEDMRGQYDALGLLREGDRCFVDKVPEIKEGKVLRKGLVRKVRA